MFGDIMYLFSFLKELISNKKIIITLSINDFKSKFSGSYFGIFWAFMQPIVTVLIYVFVFQIGFKAAPLDNNFPYVLWLIAGIVPWFFISESINLASSSLIDYNYLVKKVVFNIDILPLVKINSALFIHLFFVAFSVIVYAINGILVPITFIQIPYYMFCCLALVVSICYFTSAVVPFFKDFLQIVNIILQIGMWMCPIMWNETLLAGHESHFVTDTIPKLLRLNPVYYIVYGYRSCFMGGDKCWFFDRPLLTTYFWAFVLLSFLIGQVVFKKLKVHFADVL